MRRDQQLNMNPEIRRFSEQGHEGDQEEIRSSGEKG
jgi:hypothetical protein